MASGGVGVFQLWAMSRQAATKMWVSTASKSEGQESISKPSKATLGLGKILSPVTQDMNENT